VVGKTKNGWRIWQIISDIFIFLLAIAQDVYDQPLDHNQQQPPQAIQDKNLALQHDSGCIK
jgi:hypothetical protein